MLRALRYTKIALLIFGAGMLAGLVVVSGNYSAWQQPAAALMALGLVLIPVALFADGHGMVLLRWVILRLRGRKPTKNRARRRSPARQRKPAQSGRRSAPRSRGRNR